jgi:PKD domain
MLAVHKHPSPKSIGFAFRPWGSRMSVPNHRATGSPGPRRRRTFMTAFSAFAVLGLVSAGMAFADTVAVDGDTLSTSPQLAYKATVETPQDRLCSTRGTAVDGLLTISYNGTQHLTAGAPITVEVTNVPTNVTVTVNPADLTMPGTWNSSSPDKTIRFTTTVPASVPDQNTQIDFSVSTGSATTNGGAAQYLLFIKCTPDTQTPTNHAPVVSLTSPPSSVYESQTPVTINFTIADDAADTAWTPPTGYPSCGDFGQLVGTPVIAAAGSFQCKFPDGLEDSADSTSKIAIKVADSGGLASNEASSDIAVNNADPVVGTPTFAVSSVNCQVGASLGNISFTDAGINDKSWHVSINWGDPANTTATTFDTDTAGSQTPSPTPTHVYSTPGIYTATVTVTDKDNGVGSKSTADDAGLQVLQAYSTSFLQPFDGSTPSRLIVNQMKSGRVVPVKVTITDSCTGLALTDPNKVVTIGSKESASNGSSPDPVETYADAGTSSAGTNVFRYTTGFWIYNLDSKALNMVVGKTYRIDVYVDGIKATVNTFALLQPVK